MDKAYQKLIDGNRRFSLEKKVDERTSKLELQKQLVLQQSEEINEFMYLASHDIKGPIRSIKGLAELGIIDDNDKNQYFERIKSTSEIKSFAKALVAITNF